jgi:hypothetical protein
MTEHPLAEIIEAHEQRAVRYRINLKASARKSYGAYKPVIVYPDGRSQIVGQHLERRYREWIDGKPNIKTVFYRNYRGEIFDTRELATAYATSVIEAMARDALDQAEKLRARIANVPHRIAETIR